ncbi:hypothetical protein SNOG_02794 [Parastagonospora nodorum SN15]|uniref:Uncharacterized protein n=1 Tax=Phaeosphaeria nodorum (strain SN15 / ATCC MYA-4574 / FGSC 10173) TaxID=321614 RepID=Q0UZM0_PHANO|nr:hypothetical protein SNOG_02794 [Parastagonospora nodorum SN15]EAT89525.2 hypothetical protein SNOG_02794 [Parastagonospora nodorum SN15]
MVIFKSRQPPIDLPTEITDWDFFFDSSHSPISKYAPTELAGFQNAITKERVNWADVKKYSTYISTALTKRYGLKTGQTVALFSQNTVWYPVAMFAGLRVGAKISGASPAYNEEEMTFALKTADAKFLLTTPASMEIAAASAKAAGLPQSSVFLLEGELPGYTTIQDLIKMGESYGEANQTPAFKLQPGQKNKDLQRKFPNTGFKQGYGMTESCSCITAHPPEKFDYKYAHSGGAIVASTEVKIIKDDGTEGDVGEDGEVLARGPQIVMGYLNNAKATADTFDKDGFLHTGDRGAIDAEGMIHISDRIKELIKVKGIGVAPAELEDLLLGHPKIEDVAVMSVKDDYSGELPKAYIVLKPGIEENMAIGKEIIVYVKEKKVRYKWVKEVEFINEIPKSPSGKILRRILRDKEKSGKFGMVIKDEARAKL